ncbi:MAG: hypothetical protein U1E24_10300, partial [Phenylobacterium sp.]|nr:hypothetical protein [Phenylobacterium sp.]
MHRRSLLALLPFVLAAGPAVAAGGKAADKAGAAQYIDISPVALPVTMGDRVVNYIFVDAWIEPNPDRVAVVLRSAV